MILLGDASLALHEATLADRKKNGGYYPQESELPRIYATILGTPWIARSEGPTRAVFYSQDSKDASRILATYKWLERVSLKEWQEVAS